MPPNNCLTIIIAKAPPITGDHNGAFTGKLKASKTPVTTADKSLILTGVRIIF
jgi:hypothetical protein